MAFHNQRVVDCFYQAYPDERLLIPLRNIQWAMGRANHNFLQRKSTNTPKIAEECVGNDLRFEKNELIQQLKVVGTIKLYTRSFKT